MTESREIKHACQGLQGPHVEFPVGFVPLRLFLENEKVRLVVDRPTVVAGRHSGADLRLAFDEVSRRHCIFTFEAAQWRVYDLQSLNGVYLNDERVAEATLYTGDHLRLGCVEFLVEAATPVRILHASGDDRHDKLRQIMQFLL